jgi:hypothetical protein
MAWDEISPQAAQIRFDGVQTWADELGQRWTMGW